MENIYIKYSVDLCNKLLIFSIVRTLNLEEKSDEKI